MSFVSQTTHQKMPFPVDEVFNAVVAVIPTLGFKLRTESQMLGRITATTGISGFRGGRTSR